MQCRQWHSNHILQQIGHTLNSFHLPGGRPASIAFAAKGTQLNGLEAAAGSRKGGDEWVFNPLSPISYGLGSFHLSAH